MMQQIIVIKVQLLKNPFHQIEAHLNASEGEEVRDLSQDHLTTMKMLLIVKL